MRSSAAFRSAGRASPRTSAAPPSTWPATTPASSPARSCASTAAPGCEATAEPMQRELTIRSAKQYQVIDLTADVARVVAESALAEGLCHVYVPHATAAVVINENDDPNLCADLLDALAHLVPEGQWRHDRIDRNGAAHIKAAILGPGETIPVCN